MTIQPSQAALRKQRADAAKKAMSRRNALIENKKQFAIVRKGLANRVPQKYPYERFIVVGLDSLTPMAVALLDETLKEYVARKYANPCRLCAAMRIKHDKGRCIFTGPDASERLFASAFAPLIGGEARSLVLDSFDLKGVGEASLLANALALASPATPQTHTPVMDGRLKCLGLAAVLMADDGILPPDVVASLADAVRLAPGWIHMDPEAREVMGEEDEIG